MTLAELHPIWKEALAIHEVFRAFGFPADDLFLTRHPDGRLLIAIESVHFACFVAPEKARDAYAFKDRPSSEVEREWNEIGPLWNGGEEQELQAIYRGSVVFRKAGTLIDDMQRAGIKAPILADA